MTDAAPSNEPITSADQIEQAFAESDHDTFLRQCEENVISAEAVSYDIVFKLLEDARRYNNRIVLLFCNQLAASARNPQEWIEDAMELHLDAVVKYIDSNPSELLQPGVFDQHLDQLCRYVNKHKADTPTWLIDAITREYEDSCGREIFRKRPPWRHSVELTWNQEDPDNPIPHAEYITYDIIVYILTDGGRLKKTAGTSRQRSVDRSVHAANGHTGPAHLHFYLPKLDELQAAGLIDADKRAKCEEELGRVKNSPLFRKKPPPPSLR